MSQRRGRLRVGTSGYEYNHWRGEFYPEKLPKRDWFRRYAGHFDTVEINNSFYHLPPADSFVAWREQAPPGFCFALKFSRFGSHMKKLKEPEQTVPRFMERATLLGDTLGPILVQLPPRWRVNADRLRDFLAALDRPQRWAFEFRDPSWLCEPVYRLLDQHGAALCTHDKIPDHPLRAAPGWTYLRFHGVEYGGAYSRQTLRSWASRIEGLLAGGVDVYAYFNNDLGGHAVRDAETLRRYVRGG